MFKPSTEKTLSSLVLLLDLQNQISKYRVMCEKLAEMPNKSQEQKEIDNSYQAKLKTAEDELIKLQKNEASSDNNYSAPTFKG
jgi:hypothetical protein